MKFFAFLYLTLLTAFFFVFFQPVFAYVMSSTNYHVLFDSVNDGGGLGTSTNYKLEDTVGEVGSGFATSTSFNLYAGYQQMDQSVFLTMSISSSTVTLPSIGGLTGGSATGSVAVGIITNNSAGYSLNTKVDTNPALQSVSSSFANYPATVTPDLNWSIPATSSAFGFSPEGADIVQKYLDNGSACNQLGGSDSADKCWYYFATTDEQISSSNSANSPSVTTTTIKLKAESGTENVQSSGQYTATITITGVTN